MKSKVFVCSVFLGLACLCGAWIALRADSAAVAEPARSAAARGAALKYTTSWVGNTFGGANDKYVQMDVDGFFVAGDGSCFTNVPWEEGGHEVSLYQNGKLVAAAGHTHGWGNAGGVAVTANAKYLFFAQLMGNEGGHLAAAATWPPKGFGWHGIARRKRAAIQQGAPFPGGKGGDGDTVKGAYLLIQQQHDGAPQAVRGLAASDSRLYVSDGAANQVKVFDAETMAPLAKWNVPRPRQLALDAAGNLWVIQARPDAGGPAMVLGLDAQGRQRAALPLPAGADPSALCVDKDDRLLLADNGPDQDVKVYANLDAARGPVPTLVGTVGVTGGIFTPPVGAPGPLRFNGPVGLGADAAGNLYVACDGKAHDTRDGNYYTDNGAGVVLEAYAPDASAPGGYAGLWQLLGLEFVDCADADPATGGREVYTAQEHFVMDYAKPAGQEWAYAGQTVHRFKYPQDARLHVDNTTVGVPWVRNLRGHKFLFLTDMYANALKVFRFDPQNEGEVAVPSAILAQRPLKRDGQAWPPGEPAGEYIWRDANGDGAMQPSEYDARRADAPALWGWWVDAVGDVWQATTAKGIRHFPLQGLDARGNPVYSFAALRTSATPAPFNNLQRIEYDPAADRMILAGYTARSPLKKGNWKVVGKVAACYDRWSKNNKPEGPAPTWQIALPVDQEGNALTASVCSAGDYFFSVEVLGAKVHVYRADTGAEVGTMSPGREVGGQSGWIDVPYGLHAYKKPDGEYLIFAEDDAFAKVIMYRWKP